MSGRLHAYLHATALSLLVITGAVVLQAPALWKQVAVAGLLLFGHQVMWARASSVAFRAARSPGGERALQGLGMRPVAALPLFMVLVWWFDMVPVALAACQVVGGAMLSAASDLLQQRDASSLAAAGLEA